MLQPKYVKTALLYKLSGPLGFSSVFGNYLMNKQNYYISPTWG